MSCSLSPVLTRSPPTSSSPPLGFDSAFPPPTVIWMAVGKALRYIYLLCLPPSHGLGPNSTNPSVPPEDKDAFLDCTILFSPGFIFVNNFLWIPFVDTDHHRRTMDPGGVGYFIFLSSFSQMCKGRPVPRATTTWHTAAEGTAIDLREFLVSLTRDTQRLVASATKGGRGRQQRDTGLGKIPGGGIFFSLLLRFLYHCLDEGSVKSHVSGCLLGST